MIKLSVVICTYNRADLLEGALHSVCMQAVDPALYEVIIVDNNSSDNTKEVVTRYAGQYSNVRYVLETNVGLSHARNRGWREAISDYVAYTDDDCVVPPHWVAVALEIVRTRRPDVFGGPYRAYYTTKKPKWYKDKYGSGEHGDRAQILPEGSFLAGCNMFVSSAVLRSLNGFDTRFGMTGYRIGYGEDTDIQIRAMQLGTTKGILYDPRLKLLHHVRSDQMKLSWLARAAIAKGRFKYWLSAEPTERVRFSYCHALAALTKVIVRIIIDIVSGLLQRDHIEFPYYHNYLVERVFWRLAGFGRLQARYRQYLESQANQSRMSQ